MAEIENLDWLKEERIKSLQKIIEATDSLFSAGVEIPDNSYLYGALSLLKLELECWKITDWNK
jgi:hypothetical protein